MGGDGSERLSIDGKSNEKGNGGMSSVMMILDQRTRPLISFRI